MRVLNVSYHYEAGGCSYGVVDDGKIYVRSAF